MHLRASAWCARNGHEDQAVRHAFRAEDEALAAAVLHDPQASRVALALSDRSGGHVSWTGDLLALAAALCWASLALLVRATPLSQVGPAPQLLFQVAVSAPVLLLLAPIFGPLVRDLEPIHLVGLVYQTVAVASLGFLVWFWLLTIYPTSSVASFSFLSPVFAVILGWLLLSERVAWSIWVALGLVAAGIYLINRKPAVRGSA